MLTQYKLEKSKARKLELEAQLRETYKERRRLQQDINGLPEGAVGFLGAKRIKLVVAIAKADDKVRNLSRELRKTKEVLGCR